MVSQPSPRDRWSLDLAFRTDSPAPTKFKPQLTVNVAPALAPVSAPPNDKLLITIRHPPTEKENKFKVKATHAVGRVLSSACVAFGLNPNGYVYNSFLIPRSFWLLPPSFLIRKANIIFVIIFIAPR